MFFLIVFWAGLLSLANLERAIHDEKPTVYLNNYNNLNSALGETTTNRADSNLDVAPINQQLNSSSLSNSNDLGISDISRNNLTTKYNISLIQRLIENYLRKNYNSSSEVDIQDAADFLSKLVCINTDDSINNSEESILVIEDDDMPEGDNSDSIPNSNNDAEDDIGSQLADAGLLDISKFLQVYFEQFLKCAFSTTDDRNTRETPLNLFGTNGP